MWASIVRQGVLALLERSLRVDARAWEPHLARFGLMIAIEITTIYAINRSVVLGAPGLAFFSSVVYLDLIFMTLLGIGFFSTAITEEKEEDTLGLILMAGISPLGILIGKSMGRLIQAILLMAIQFPFTLLAITLGGVTQDQFRSAYVAMAAYMIMLWGLGLLCSTISSSSRVASIRLTGVLAVYFLVPILCLRLLSGTTITGSNYDHFLNWITTMSVMTEMSEILSTGYHESPWNH